MNILYLTTAFPHENQSDTIYTDLASALSRKGHNVTIIVSEEKRNFKPMGIHTERGCQVLRVKTGNLYDVSLFEKGISMLTLGAKIKKACYGILRYKKFDLILYVAPPLTLYKAVRIIKKRFQIPTFLMMKDIFPQNALDIKIIRKGIIYAYFKYQEKQLYKSADRIGCMSEANKKYLLDNNNIPENNISIFPNTKAIMPLSKNPFHISKIRMKFNIPNKAVVFIFGGNMGKPQGMDFLCQAISNAVMKVSDAFFILVGRGTEKEKVKKKLGNLKSVLILDNLPRDDYEALVQGADVGIVSLDYRFTIPNYPSRILSYMEYGMPILAATDTATDLKELIEKSTCGLWCPSNSVDKFTENVQFLVMNETIRKQYGLSGRKYLEENFHVNISVELLEKFVEEQKHV